MTSWQVRGVPFRERGGWIRGCLDLAAGRFPAFVFGGGVGELLPVFHFHAETREQLDPKLRYLAENGYRTVTADEIGDFVRRNRRLPQRSVALCFDDAWATVWTTAAPLLKQYGLRAIVYAIPGRTVEAAGCRAQRTNGGATEDSPFMTWPELRALAAEGTIDVQSHTLTHAMVFTSNELVGFVRPGYEASPLLARPLLDHTGLRPTYVTASDLGAPLYEQRSRMSDGYRVGTPRAAHDACVRLVAAEGGPHFFSRADWRPRLEAIVREHRTVCVAESDEDRRRSIERELDEARSTLNARLGGAINHVCLPWGVSGVQTASALRRLGFTTAIANRLRGVHAVRPGDDPHWLKRLPNRYIYRLPGRGRRWWFFER